MNLLHKIPLLFFAILCSCGNKLSPIENEDAKHHVISLDEAIENQAFSFEKFNGNIRYVQLETTTESVLAEIHFMGLLNDTIVVMDAERRIMSFTDSGKFVGIIGRMGEGPNEYRSVRSICFDRNLKHVLVTDINSRIFRYDLTGHLINVYKVANKMIKSPISFSAFSNGYMFNYYKASKIAPYAHSYYGIDQTLKSQFINPHPLYNCEASGWIAHPLVSLGDTVVFLKPLSDTIFQFLDGKVTHRFIFQHESPSLPQQRIDYYNNVKEELYYTSYLIQQQKDGYFIGFQSVYETNDFLLFSLGLANMDKYLFDKSNESMYKITKCKDVESEHLL